MKKIQQKMHPLNLFIDSNQFNYKSKQTVVQNKQKKKFSSQTSLPFLATPKNLSKIYIQQRSPDKQDYIEYLKQKQKKQSSRFKDSGIFQKSSEKNQQTKLRELNLANLKVKGLEGKIKEKQILIYKMKKEILQKNQVIEYLQKEIDKYKISELRYQQENQQIKNQFIQMKLKVQSSDLLKQSIIPLYEQYRTIYSQSYNQLYYEFINLVQIFENMAKQIQQKLQQNRTSQQSYGDINMIKNQINESLRFARSNTEQYQRFQYELNNFNFVKDTKVCDIIDIQLENMNKDQIGDIHEPQQN